MGHLGVWAGKTTQGHSTGGGGFGQTTTGALQDIFNLKYIWGFFGNVLVFGPLLESVVVVHVYKKASVLCSIASVCCLVI